MKRTDSTCYLEVFVRSEVRPVVLKKGIIEHGQYSQQKERQVVGALAGALAELLCDQHKDTLEPSAVARAAMECYDEMVAENPVLKLGDELACDADARMAKH